MIATEGLQGITFALRQDYPYRNLQLNPGASCLQKCPSNPQGELATIYIKENDTKCSLPAAQ